MGIVDSLIASLLEELKIEQRDIDKATNILDMISFTKEDGKDVIIIQIGENVQVKINK
jgi:hypothetical protein